MINNNKKWQQFEKMQLEMPLSLEESAKIYQSMYEIALTSGALAEEYLLEGLDHDIERTRKIHAIRKIAY